ncbi:MAG: hypothetical protein J6M35_02780, partial [Clostridia bacterium]|nr:hypothetical protein [Clostridia bacterium]
MLAITMLFSMMTPALYAAEELENPVVPDNNYNSPDNNYNSPDNYDKSKTATDLYYDRYTDVTLSLPGEAETLASDIVFVVDKSSSDLWSGEEATALFDQLIDLQKKTGALIN